MSKCAIAILTASIAALWIISIRLYPTLPATIPLHFDFAGTPDRFGPPSFGNWFGLPILGTLIGVFLIAIMAVVPWLLRVAPGIVNIPRKPQLLALPPYSQRRALAPMTTMMTMIATAVEWMLITIIYGTARIATGDATILAPWPLFVLIALILVLAVIGHFATVRRIDSEFAVQSAINAVRDSANENAAKLR